MQCVGYSRFTITPAQVEAACRIKKHKGYIDTDEDMWVNTHDPGLRPVNVHKQINSQQVDLFKWMHLKKVQTSLIRVKIGE